MNQSLWVQYIYYIDINRDVFKNNAQELFVFNKVKPGYSQKPHNDKYYIYDKFITILNLLQLPRL